MVPLASAWLDGGSMVHRSSVWSRVSSPAVFPRFALDAASRLNGVTLSGSNWGLAFLALGVAVQLTGGYFRVETLEGLALLPFLCGIALLLGGLPALEWVWPAIGFLAFMIPLPWRLENALGPPLQFIATTISTYFLQVLGFMAFAEGNVIHVNDAQIGVVEACSGLSMLVTFTALSTAAALVVKRPLLDRIALVASSIPVALIANITRITLTGILHEDVGAHAAAGFYHDLAGWLMIPLALILYWLEIGILSRLLIEANDRAFVLLELGGSKPQVREAERESNVSRLQTIASLSQTR